jgi:hypothetical protein
MFSARGRVDKECPQCHTMFSALKNQHDKRHYCSYACANAARTPDSYDLSKFAVNTPFMNWFLGWMMTDGSVSMQKRTSLSIVDREVIDIMATYINYKPQIYSYIPKSLGGYNIKRVYNLRLKHDITDKLVSLGFSCGIKTGHEFIPECVTDDLFSHFMRGAIEGDGNLYLSNGKYIRFSARLFCMNYDFLKAVLARLQRINVVKHGHINKKKTNGKLGYIYTLGFSTRDALPLCNYMYQDSDNLRLTRKYKTYLAAKAMKEIPYD